jgi:hypothetical protein
MVPILPCRLFRGWRAIARARRCQGVHPVVITRGLAWVPLPSRVAPSPWTGGAASSLGERGIATEPWRYGASSEACVVEAQACGSSVGACRIDLVRDSVPASSLRDCRRLAFPNARLRSVYVMLCRLAAPSRRVSADGWLRLSLCPSCLASRDAPSIFHP